MPQERLAVTLLGRAEVRYDGVVVSPNVPPKTIELLAYILLHPSRRVEREAAAFALWPDEPEDRALANVRRYLYRLTRDLLPATARPWLTMTARSIAWRDDAPLTCDVAEFEAATTPPVDVERVLDLYGADLLAAFDEPWLEPLRTRLRERFAQAGHAALERRGGVPPRSALALAKRLIAHDPLDEVAVRAVLRCRAELGDRINALREFDDFRTLARDEFGVEPSDETRALHERIVAELRTTMTTPGDPRLASVPLSATPLFGREAERSDVGEALTAHVLVTLLGIGGIGKTRLAIDVATSMIDLFPGGVAFVDVARAESAERLLPVFAEALGLSTLATPGDLETRAIAALAAERRVVVVDNGERQPAAVARLLNRLVPLGGGSRFIVTSREPLDLDAGFVHRVRPLDRASATAVFVDRARRALRPDAAASSPALEPGAVETIVARLGGIPLALELAASRAATVGLDDLAARVEQAIGLEPKRSGRPPSRKTMGAVLDWSYDCLDAETARIFRQLSTFAGGWTAEMASAAFAAGEDRKVRSALGELVDAALVVVDRSRATTRYRFLEPLRSYAALRLEREGEARAALGDHAREVLRAAEAFVDAGRSLPTAERVARANLDVDDLRAALRWALVDGNDLELGRRLAAASMYFLFIAPDEGRAHVLHALRTVDGGSSLNTQAKLYHALSRHAKESRRFAEAHAAANDAIELARTLGDDDLLCAFTLNAILAAIGAHHLDEAEALATQCIALSRARGHRLFEQHARGFLPVVVSARGDYDRARVLFLQSLSSEAVAGDDAVASRMQAVDDRGNFAENEFLAGRVDEAIRLNAQAIAIAEEGGELPSLRAMRMNHGLYLCAAARFSEAREAAQATIAEARDAGLGALVTSALGALADVARARGRHAEAAAVVAYVERRFAAREFACGAIQELHAAGCAARLAEVLDRAARTRASERAATWTEEIAIDVALTASREAEAAGVLCP